MSERFPRSIMVVVADSSPLVVLIQIGHVEILPTLFGQVIIPPQIAAELSQPKRPKAVRSFIAARPQRTIRRAEICFRHGSGPNRGRAT